MHVDVRYVNAADLEIPAQGLSEALE